MEQMMALLLAEIKTEIRTNQAKTDSTLRELRAGQEFLKEEMLAKLGIHYGRMMARVNSQVEKMEATDLEENPEEIEFGLSLRRSLRKRPQWNLLEH
jgi:hypothetical protein